MFFYAEVSIIISYWLATNKIVLFCISSIASYSYFVTGENVYM